VVNCSNANSSGGEPDATAASEKVADAVGTHTGEVVVVVVMSSVVRKVENTVSIVPAAWVVAGVVVKAK